MKFTTITRWEFKETLKSKKFLIIFCLQLSMLFLMIFVFNAFAANIQSDNGVSLTPSLSGFASLDIDDQGHLFTKYINPSLINIQSSNYNTALQNLNNGEITGFVQVPADSLNSIKNIDTINVKLYLDYSDPKRSVISDEVNSTTNILATSISNSWIDSLIPQNTTQIVVNQQSTGQSLQIQLLTNAMLAILLFLPLFFFGNLIIDSVVGEKEKKTGEILMAMPISPSQIILGKILAVEAIIALQIVLWMIILITMGFKFANPILIYILVTITALPIIGVTTIISAYSKNYKEAGIGITLSYIAVVGVLIIPALTYLSVKPLAANISPMTMVMRILSGETIPFWQYFIPIAFILLVSIITYWISIKLFERDDIFFGPRPGLIRLFLELISFKKIKKIR
jgi:ABC-2 type transport system permease protein